MWGLFNIFNLKIRRFNDKISFIGQFYVDSTLRIYVIGKPRQEATIEKKKPETLFPTSCALSRARTGTDRSIGV